MAMPEWTFPLSPEIISNREYDALYDELLSLEQETGVVFSDSPTQNVGYETVTVLPKKAHAQPMLSQNKTKSVEELQASRIFGPSLSFNRHVTDG